MGTPPPEAEVPAPGRAGTSQNDHRGAAIEGNHSEPEPVELHVARNATSRLLAMAANQGVAVVGLCGFSRVPIHPRPEAYVICAVCSRIESEVER